MKVKKTGDFTHMDKEGRVKMIDVTGKNKTLRTAKARGYIILNKEIISKIRGNRLKKGNVFAVARIAGIGAAKRNWELIPLCHQVKLTHIDLNFRIIEKENKIGAEVSVKGYDATGVEMEALTAVSLSMLTIYDMCKSMSKSIKIGGIELIEKTGGKADYIKDSAGNN
jgi:cyclic pyranopterin phosphate synthase